MAPGGSRRHNMGCCWVLSRGVMQPVLGFRIGPALQQPMWKWTGEDRQEAGDRSGCGTDQRDAALTWGRGKKQAGYACRGCEGPTTRQENLMLSPYCVAATAGSPFRWDSCHVADEENEAQGGLMSRSYSW